MSLRAAPHPLAQNRAHHGRSTVISTALRLLLNQVTEEAGGLHTSLGRMESNPWCRALVERCCCTDKLRSADGHGLVRVRIDGRGWLFAALGFTGARPVCLLAKKAQA